MWCLTLLNTRAHTHAQTGKETQARTSWCGFYRLQHITLQAHRYPPFLCMKFIFACCLSSMSRFRFGSIACVRCAYFTLLPKLKHTFLSISFRNQKTVIHFYFAWEILVHMHDKQECLLIKLLKQWNRLQWRKWCITSTKPFLSSFWKYSIAWSDCDCSKTCKHHGECISEKYIWNFCIFLHVCCGFL